MEDSSKTITMLFDENRRLRQALEYALSGILVTNPVGVVRFVNRKWLEMNNLEMNQIMNKSIFELETMGTKAQITKQMQAATSDGVPIELSFKRPGHGKTIYVSGIIKRLLDKESKETGFLWAVHDITEQKIAQESLERRNKQLSKLNKLMVGRELEMVKLKKEIKKLKETLKKKKPARVVSPSD